MILTGIVFFGILIAIVILYVATGLWLDNHGGARRWQVWVMMVVTCAAVGADMAMTAGLRFIGLGAAFGAVVGAIVGLFVKVPQPSRQRHQESLTRPR